MSLWISAGGQRAVVDADVVEQPGEPLAPNTALPPSFSGPVETAIAPLAAERRDLRCRSRTAAGSLPS